MFSLANKVGLVVGIGNEKSIGWGCARALHEAGAELAITYHARAEDRVRPLAEKLDAPIILPLEITDDAQLDTVFASIMQHWGRLDFLLHCLAYCPRNDLHGRVVGASLRGFELGMNICGHSFPRMRRRAEPLMPDGGSCLTISYLGSERVVSNYGIMGPIKAALEAIGRYSAVELGPKGIRINALSPGPLRTRSASGLANFDALLGEVAGRI